MVEIKRIDTPVTVTSTNLATGGIYVELQKQALKNLIILNNTGTEDATVTVSKGTVERFAVNDLTITVPKSSKVALQLETAQYLILDGHANNNKVKISGPATTSIECYSLI